MNLGDLPNEKIYEICEAMDPVDLNKFIRTSKQNRDICQSILDKKFEKEVESVKRELKKKGLGTVHYIKKFETGPYESSFIAFNYEDGNELHVTQEDKVRPPPSMWMFTNLNIEDLVGNKKRKITRYSEIFNISDIAKYIKLLMTNGYHKVIY